MQLAYFSRMVSFESLNDPKDKGIQATTLQLRIAVWSEARSGLYMNVFMFSRGIRPREIGCEISERRHVMKTKQFYVFSGVSSHKKLFLSLTVVVLLCGLGIAFAIELPEPFSTGTQGFNLGSTDLSGQISSNATAGSTTGSSGISNGASSSSQISFGSSSSQAGDDHSYNATLVEPCDPFIDLMGNSVAVVMEGNVVLTGVLQGTCSNYLTLLYNTKMTVVNLQKVLYIESL